VLFPTDCVGRVMELLLFLELYWKQKEITVRNAMHYTDGTVCGHALH
jgi:Cft2 family RNA processing exonuclease